MKIYKYYTVELYREDVLDKRI